MSRHLTGEEIVDRLEERLAANRATHLEACAACRAAVADAGAVIESIGSGPVPEPSPLFWTHSAARVRAAIAAEPVPARRRWPRLAWAGGSLAAAAIAVLLVAGRPDQAPPPAQPVAAIAAPAVWPADVPADQAEDDEPWALVAALGGELDVESATRSGLLPSGGLADRALLSLDEAERLELAALLEGELRRPEI